MIFFYCLKIATMKKKYPLTAESLAKLKCNVDSSLRGSVICENRRIFFFSISYVNASTKKRERRLISRENADVIVN